MHMATDTTPWTLEQLHRLPDDGNKYELVRGELFVTPAPSEDHETILAYLTRAIDDYVARHSLGVVYRARAVMRFDGSEVEPDLMVRQPRRKPAKDWEDAPVPLLIVEVLSGSTRRRDRAQKRELYLDAGVGEYWIVDPERRCVHVIARGVSDRVVTDVIRWNPPGADEPLDVSVAALFRDDPGAT
jgi:Uma2 family endonuclease